MTTILQHAAMATVATTLATLVPWFAATCPTGSSRGFRRKSRTGLVSAEAGPLRRKLFFFILNRAGGSL